MDIQHGDISTMVFKTEIKSESSNISLDINTLRVLAELDGRQQLGLIAQKLGMNMTTIRAAISRLIELELVQIAEQSIPMLDSNFFDFLTDRLSLTIGPIAQIMVDDAVREIGHGAPQIPKNRGAELIELLARQVPQKEHFIQAAMEKLKEI